MVDNQQMIYLKIAENSLGIATGKRDAMLNRMPNYAPFITEKPDQKLLFSVDIDRKIDIPDEAPVKVFDYDITDDSATLRIYPERYILSILNAASGETFSIDCPMCQGSEDAKYSFLSDLAAGKIAPPRHIIDHLLIFAYSIAALPQDTLLIHASTITYKGKAVLFLAESGTGKSTHSQMWLANIEGSTLLNDDAPILRIDKDGTAIAYGTPWSGKTPCYKNEQYPIAALVRIRRAPYNKITRQNIISSLGALLPSSMPTLQQTEETIDALCDTLSKSISSTPVYILDCLPDSAAAKVCCTEIFKL